MAIELIPEDRYERVQRELRASAPPEPDIANIGPIMELGAQAFFVFRGRTYVADPTPYRIGLRLQVLYQTLRNVKDQDAPVIADYEKWCEEVVGILRVLCRPARVPRPLFAITRRLLRNPFEAATDLEIGELLGFFLGLRTTSSVSIRRT